MSNDKIADAVNHLSVAAREVNDAAKDYPFESPVVTELEMIHEQIVTLEIKLLNLRRRGVD